MQSCHFCNDYLFTINRSHFFSTIDPIIPNPATTNVIVPVITNIVAPESILSPVIRVRLLSVTWRYIPTDRIVTPIV